MSIIGLSAIIQVKTISRIIIYIIIMRKGMVSAVAIAKAPNVSIYRVNLRIQFSIVKSMGNFWNNDLASGIDIVYRVQ